MVLRKLIVPALVLGIALFPQRAACAEHAQVFSFKEKDFGKIEFIRIKVEQDRIDFEVSYPDASYRSYRYEGKVHDNIVSLNRVDDRESAEKTVRWYGLSGSVSGLKKGVYLFQIRRKKKILLSQDFAVK